MYTAHQIDCLKQMGVEFFSTRNATITDTANIKQGARTVIEEELSIEFADTFITDLKVLFPKLQVEGSVLKLSDSFKWRFQPGTTRLIATKTQLISPAIESLTVKDWQQIWSHLSLHSSF